MPPAPRSEHCTRNTNGPEITDHNAMTRTDSIWKGPPAGLIVIVVAVMVRLASLSVPRLVENDGAIANEL